MLGRYNYDELVDLLGGAEGESWADNRLSIPLSDAVRTVIEQWDQFQQMSVTIRAESGAITGLDEVRAIYNRDDFPSGSRDNAL